jgi:hypothetical protein
MYRLFGDNYDQPHRPHGHPSAPTRQLLASHRVGGLLVCGVTAPWILTVSWHFADASGGTVILVGLEPGPKVLIELADPTHKVITSETVTFTVPNLR